VGGEGGLRPKAADIDYALTLARGIGYAKGWQPAISGQGGRIVAFHLACCLIHGLGIRAGDALAIMLRHWNWRCEPEWSEPELRQRVLSALATGHYTPIPEKRRG